MANGNLVTSQAEALTRMMAFPQPETPEQLQKLWDGCAVWFSQTGPDDMHTPEDMMKWVFENLMFVHLAVAGTCKGIDPCELYGVDKDSWGAFGAEMGRALRERHDREEAAKAQDENTSEVAR